MDIQIPSPSVFLQPSPIPSTANAPPPSNKKPAHGKTSQRRKSNGHAAIVKPKQSKSRNGCTTCKKKRLKCDEIKPACQQCQRRNVDCEGYKKDYKWRAFEDTTFNSKVALKAKSQASLPRDKECSPTLDSAFASATHVFSDITDPANRALVQKDEESLLAPLIDGSNVSDQLPEHLPSELSTSTTSTLKSIPHISTETCSEYVDSISASSDDIPDLSSFDCQDYQDGLGNEFSDVILDASHPHNFLPTDEQNVLESDEEADEELVRDAISNESMPQWQRRESSPVGSEASTTSGSTEMMMLATPGLDMSSPEMLMLRFDRHTCGILSVKDGPTENPWRTLVWPLARGSEALYHAIASMTAFHGGYEDPHLRVAGVAHMTKSIRKLGVEIENMRLDSALATSLSLALSEGWDEKTSTGIQHLRGAKIMVNNAVIRHRHDASQGIITASDATRLKFLCNTFIYLDVIARLTSDEEEQDLNFEDILAIANPPMGDLVEVDPLMGCAATLFPIIGRVANLIQKVRKIKGNSLAIVSQAMELKEQLVQWQTPSSYIFERPEDPTSEITHSIQTAEAYRHGILLYLHQAVPEIPADPAEAIAKRVLMLLASVPLSSRTTIVQIFPLFVASCEVQTQEDRAWVTDRWAAMILRLRIGNVESCWNVVQEVWRRRDEYEFGKAQRLMRRYTSRGLSAGSILPEMPTLTRRLTSCETPFDTLDPEYTIRGRLHWLSVMSDWCWEGTCSELEALDMLTRLVFLG